MTAVQEVKILFVFKRRRKIKNIERTGDIFNRVLSERLSRHTESTALAGDLARLAGTNSWFSVVQAELNSIQQRIDIKDMFKVGLVLDILGILIIAGFCYIYLT